MENNPAAGNLFPGTEEIWKAKKRIAGLIEYTPLVYSAGLSKAYRASIYLKFEFIQPTKSFKIRGAANKILSLSDEERQRGVATFSTGNHGLAVAYVAGKMGIPAAIFISERVPEVKVNNLRALGVNLVIYGENQDDAEDYCYQKAEEEGWVVVKPFDDAMVISGQGTIGLEILEQLPNLDAVIVPLSGGGLISGIALALKNNLPRLKVIGVSMEGSPAMYHSLKAGEPVNLKEKNTLADSLLGGIGLDNKYTFSIVRNHVDDLVLVSEKRIASAMAALFREDRIAVEGAAATTVAALDEHNLIKPGSRVVLVLSGSNIDSLNFTRVIGDYLKS